MFSKLLKNDLKKNMRWLWILFVSTIVVAGIARGCKELSETIGFFQVLRIIFESLAYTLIANVIIQPFLRSFLNFSKSLYSDESYLTHTLPVKKSLIINSKFLTALIELVLAFLTVVLSVLVMFAGPGAVDFIKLLLSTLISGEISVFWTLAIFVTLIIVEFYMFISIIFLSIVIAYRSREKRVLKSFLYSAGFAFAFLAVLAGAMVVVMIINNVDILSSTLVLSKNAFLSLMLTGIIVYSLACVLCWTLTLREFKKGVNVD